MAVGGPLERFREAEAELVRQWFTPGSRVLDIGAGTGYQARIFDSWGCDVFAVDVEIRSPAHQFWPVTLFDGINLPFDDNWFDVVFTSNVLEHVRERERLLHEIARVVRPGGCAIHVVPSATWRLWTSAARYLHALGRGLGRSSPPADASPDRSGSDLAPPAGRSVPGRMCDRLLGPPHGEYVSTLSELFRYRRSEWQRVVAGRGWRPTVSRGTGLFYTGYTLAPRLSLALRRRLARVLGSSCHTFVLRRDASAAAKQEP